MAPRSKVALLALAAVAGRALGQQPCLDVTGLYAMESNEITIKQTGCVISGTDLYGNSVTGSVLFGNTVSLTISQPGAQPVNLGGTFDQVAGTITLLGTTTALKKLNCSRTWPGFWVGSNGWQLMISVNKGQCSGVVYSPLIQQGDMAVPIILSPMNATIQNFNGNTVTAVMIGRERMSLLGANYTLNGTNPCFNNDDFNVNPTCFRDIVNLNSTYAMISSSFPANKGSWSIMHDYMCISGSATQSQCPAACNWVTNTAGQGSCVCNTQASCVAGGFSWVTAGYLYCTPGVADKLVTATGDCCPSNTNFCAYFGQKPNLNSPATTTTAMPTATMPMPMPMPTTTMPMPMPMPTTTMPMPMPTTMPMPTPSYPGGNCKRLPSSQIRDLEMATGRIVRRCGSGPMPMPMPMPPPPNYMPSPSYWAPSPWYMPSPSWMGPPPSPSYSMPPPSPSYMPPTPSSKR